MAEKFTLSREEAASTLGISTRTIDRYIKSGKLGYKKIANKILLNDRDIQSLQADFDMLHSRAETTELVSRAQTITTTSSSAIKHADTSALEKVIDEKIDKFFLIFQEKDRMLEEKNKVIFMLQQRVGELESKIKTMVALPDYNEEKQMATIEKSKLEEKIKQLSRVVGIEKTKGSIYLAVVVVGILFAVLWFVMVNK